MRHAGLRTSCRDRSTPWHRAWSASASKRDLPDTSTWGRIVADAVSEGIGLLDEVGQAVAPNLAAELADVKRRLSALEARSARE
jgi:hypothetical protein